MAIKATGQKTIIDLSDGKSLSAYLTSNHPRTQIFNSNTNEFSPSWASTNLVITPTVYANQVAIDLSDPNLNIDWKRKDGSGMEALLDETYEIVTGNVLTVTRNALSFFSGDMATYIAQIRYVDPDTNLPINIMTEISYVMVRTGVNAASVFITGEQVFKYASSTASPFPAQISLTANVQNATLGKWQYKNSSGAWLDYPTTSDNATITGTTLNVKPTHNIWVNETATLRISASNANSQVSDTMSLYKVIDGSAGVEASTAFLTNENITFPAYANGKLVGDGTDGQKLFTKYCNIVAYTGITKVKPVIGTPYGDYVSESIGELGGIYIGKLSDSSMDDPNEVGLTIRAYQNYELAGSGEASGQIFIPITSPVETTLIINWSKVKTGASGAPGAPGENAVVFSLYTPNGSITINGSGSLLVAVSAYDGATEVTSATYKWYKYVSGSWSLFPDDTSSTIEIDGSEIVGTSTIKCEMTYNGKVYTDFITLEDKTDNYLATIDSSGGDVFKNTVGESTLTCRLFQNGVEVDTAGTQFTYKWYRRDKDGNSLDGGAVFATGKSVRVNGDDVDVKTTFTCEVE